jgi:hypothetical protein
MPHSFMNNVDCKSVQFAPHPSPLPSGLPARSRFGEGRGEGGSEGGLDDKDEQSGNEWGEGCSFLRNEKEVLWE